MIGGVNLFWLFPKRSTKSALKTLMSRGFLKRWPVLIVLHEEDVLLVREELMAIEGQRRPKEEVE